MRKKHPERASRAHAIERARIMVRMLQQGDKSRDELIDTVQRQLGERAYGSSPQDSFENDKALLKELGFETRYLKRENVYHLESKAHPFLSLPLTEEQREMLPMIRQAFATTPYAEIVNQLIEQIHSCLPTDTREKVSINPSLSIVLANVDALAPHMATIRKLTEAIECHRALEFDYRSPRTNRVISHIVEPHDSLEYRDGHFYFEAYNRKWERDFDYRADRIVPGTIHLLPPKFAEGRTAPAMLPLRYHLSAQVARYGASRRFADHQEEKQADDSMVVTAKIEKDKIFWASKILLKYGENCTVLEPPELIEEMKKAVNGMAQNYGLTVV